MPPAARAPRLLAPLFAVSLGCGGPPAADAGPDGAARDEGGDAGDAGSDAGPLPACGTDAPLALGLCVDAARYRADLETIAMPRPPGSAHWQAVQDLCATRLESLGFTVERHAYDTGVNVVGVRLGTSEPDRRVLIGAHYDSTTDCPGADDNASGVAGALEAARVLARASFPRTLVVACWDEEERGLIGSEAYAARARGSGEAFDAHFDFEMIGYRDETPGSQTIPPGLDLLYPREAEALERNGHRGDFIAVIGDEVASGAAMESMERYAARIGLPMVVLPVDETLLGSPAIGHLRRSDHASFWDRGYPGIMITDTSEFRYAAYHCHEGTDEVANLDPDFASAVVTVTVAAAAEALGL